MVAPIGNIVNKFIISPTFSPSTMSFANVNSSLPTVSFVNDIGIDNSLGQVPAFDCEVRERNPTFAANLSRESLLASSGWATLYHNRMDTSMDCNSTMGELTPELPYKTEQEKALWVSRVANQQKTTRPMGGYNEAPPIHAPHEESIINIQIPYDTQALTEPELWSGSFHPISLHGSIEHFALDAENIKITLNFLAKYIKNKQVNGSMVNELNDFNSMGDAIWNFISSVYEARQDSLYTNQKSNTLRAKISLKFTPRTTPPNNGNKKNIAKLALVTINKVLSPPPLPAKTRKEVNVISKYFQSKKPMVENKDQGKNNSYGKSYAQASKPSINTLEVLKIKETFPSLSTKKIDQVNSIVNSQSKPKLCIKMMTKDPSRKQVIIPMSGENINTFMKNSSLHVANINRLLCNAKSDVLVNYI